MKIARVFSGILLLVPILLVGQSASRFSGTWKMDPARSESAHQAVPIGPVTLIVEQTDSEMRVETRRSKLDKSPPQIEVISYKLDGTEKTENAKDGSVIKSKAHRDGEAVVVETERQIQGSSITTRNVFRLNPAGTELTLDRKLTVQHGYQGVDAKSYGTGIDVFIKTTSSR